MNVRPPSFLILHLLATVALLGGALACSGCATTGVEERPGNPAPAPVLGFAATTGRVLTRADVQLATSTLFFGDSLYAEVNSRWLARYYVDFRAELFRLGVLRWDRRFDCNRFAEFYASLAQARFYRDTFQSALPAQSLAIAPFWYLRADGKGAHAVVQALTERGRLFIDPQTGHEVTLSVTESATGYYRFF